MRKKVDYQQTGLTVNEEIFSNKNLKGINFYIYIFLNN